MVRSVRQALHLFMDERIWRRIQLNGMAKDFSWKGSAVEYVKVYAAARTVRGCRLYPSRFQRLRCKKPKACCNI